MRLNKRQRNLALVCGLALLVVLLLALLEPGYADICTKAQHADHEDCPRYNLVYVALWHLAKGLDAASGVVTAFATALLTAITYMLVRLGREQSATTQAQLRAYVFVSSKFPVIPQEGNYVSELILRNSGTTPAYKVTDRRNTWIVGYPDRGEIAQGEIEEDKGNAIFCIGPSDEVTLTEEIHISGEDLIAIQKETAAVYSVIEITYEDTFGKTWNSRAEFMLTGDRISEGEDRRMNIISYSAT